MTLNGIPGGKVSHMLYRLLQYLPGRASVIGNITVVYVQPRAVLTSSLNSPLLEPPEPA
jgi:hypothetical protein